MPRTIEKTVYKYAELEGRAKERARDWYLQGFDFSFSAESLLDDFKVTAAKLGLELASGRHSARKLAVYYCLGGSQGDGASYSGTWRASGLDAAAVAAEWPATWTDSGGQVHANKHGVELARIVAELQKAALMAPTVYAHVTNSHRSHFLSVSVHAEDTEGDDVDADDDLSDIVAEALRDLAAWLHGLLEADYEYQTSEEAVAESMAANEYEFEESGRIA